LYYAWGTGRAEHLQEALNELGAQDAVAIHLSDIAEGFKNGVEAFLADLETDPTRLASATLVANQMFSTLRNSDIDGTNP